MPVSESKKKANRKWDEKNIRTVATRIRKETAEQLKEYAERHGTTVSKILSDYIKELLSSEEPQSKE